MAAPPGELTSRENQRSGLLSRPAPGAGPRPSRLAFAVLLCAVGLILLLAVIAAAFFVLGDDDQARPVPDANVQVGEETDQALIQAATTPTVSVNPTNRSNLVMGYRIERPAFSCAVATSFDEGRSWDPSALSLPPGTERCYTTSPVFDRDGTLHLAFVTLAGPNNLPTAAWVTRSTDGGRTFASASQVLGGEKFMVRLAVDPASSPAKLHLTWVEGSGVGLFQMAPPSSVMASTSTDGGRTFGPPVRVSDRRRERVGAPVPVVGSGGGLHVLFYDYKKDVFDFQNTPGRYTETFDLVAATSTDGGRTFSEAVVNGAVRPPEPFMVFTPPFPSLAVDPKEGTLYAAWSDARTARPSVLLARSTDRGRSWDEPRRVDDRAGAALLPQLSVAPNGRLDVAWASVGEARGGPTEVRVTSSRDEGRTFGPAQALNQPFNRDLLPNNPRRDVANDLGSALALVSTDQSAFVAWPDTRRGNPDSLRVDIVGAPVRMSLDGGRRDLPDID